METGAAQVDVPFLSGQPGWVIVIVVVLLVGGSLGGIYLRRRAPATDPPSPPVTEGNALAILHAAMEHLAEHGERAEKENRRLRKELRECAEELTECERRAHQLAARAWSEQADSGPSADGPPGGSGGGHPSR